MDLALPRPVARRILERALRGEVTVVVPRRGRPARVYSLESYLKMRDVPVCNEIWKHRGKGRPAPDPLRAGDVARRVLRPLRREEFYD